MIFFSQKKRHPQLETTLDCCREVLKLVAESSIGGMSPNIFLDHKKSAEQLELLPYGLFGYALASQREGNAKRLNSEDPIPTQRNNFIKLKKYQAESDNHHLSKIYNAFDAFKDSQASKSEGFSLEDAVMIDYALENDNFDSQNNPIKCVGQCGDKAIRAAIYLSEKTRQQVLKNIRVSLVVETEIDHAFLIIEHNLKRTQALTNFQQLDEASTVILDPWLQCVFTLDKLPVYGDLCERYSCYKDFKLEVRMELTEENCQIIERTRNALIV